MFNHWILRENQPLKHLIKQASDRHYGKHEKEYEEGKFTAVRERRILLTYSVVEGREEQHTRHGNPNLVKRNMQYCHQLASTLFHSLPTKRAGVNLPLPALPKSVSTSFFVDRILGPLPKRCFVDFLMHINEACGFDAGAAPIDGVEWLVCPFSPPSRGI